MTVQEIFEREGFLILSASREAPIGLVRIPDLPEAIPEGQPVRVIGQATGRENLAYCKRYGLIPGAGPFYYKVIAE